MFTSCTHTHESGSTCQSPAIRGTSLCFNHTPHQNIKRRQHHEYEPFELPPLHSKNAVLVAISQVLNRLAMRRIKRSEADTFLRGLSLVARLMTELDESIPSYPAGDDHNHVAAPEQQKPSLPASRMRVDSMPAEFDGPTSKEIEEMLAAMPHATPEQLLNHWLAARQPRPVPGTRREQRPSGL